MKRRSLRNSGWQLAAGDWQASNWQLAAGRFDTGNWRLETGNWHVHMILVLLKLECWINDVQAVKIV
jgi:uncharacterized cupin superfamily protein